MYSADTLLILEFMGYESPVDFEFRPQSGTLDWFAAGPKPTEQQVLDNRLPWLRSDERDRVQAAAVKKYAQYATDAPGKDAVYAAKYAEAMTHYNGGNYAGPVGPVYMQARINRTGELPSAITDEYLLRGNGWHAIAAAVDAIVDDATAQIATASETTAPLLADGFIAEIEAI